MIVYYHEGNFSHKGPNLDERNLQKGASGSIA
jgi:hypothetical protein